MLPALETLIRLQQLDSAAEAARRRLAELPAAEEALDERIAQASSVLAAVEDRAADNLGRRRELEKEVAQVDSRLSRFDDHKASVKTNQEFTALLHEIEIARGSKDALEERILVLLEDADRIAADRAAAEQGVAAARREVDAGRSELGAERKALEAEIATLGGARDAEIAGLDAALRARYEQLLKQRRMLAVVPLDGEVCGGCHMKLRPVVTQHVRGNDSVVTCDNCQRILYAPARPAAPETGDAAQQA